MVFGCHDNVNCRGTYNNQLPQWPCFRPIPGSGIGCTVVQTLAYSGTVLVEMSLYTKAPSCPVDERSAGPDFLSCQSDMLLTFARGSNNTIRRFGSVESNAF
jgi:hypothetical protein